MTRNKYTETITAKLTSADYDALVMLSERNDVALSKLIRNILNAHVSRESMLKSMKTQINENMCKFT